MTQIQMEFAPSSNGRVVAEKRRDKGIEKAVKHAELEIPEWRRHALDSLILFIASQADAPFLMETFVAWHEGRGWLGPPDRRAYGGVMRSAAAMGWVRKIGTAPANTSNRSPKCLWKRAQ